MFTAAASNALDAALMLTKLVNADYEQRPELARQLKDLEHVADHTTHDIMRALNTSLITPFDREDIAVLAARMDDVVDHIEAAADLTVLYRIETLPSAVRHQAELLEEAARMTADGMGRLRTLQKLEDTGSRSMTSRIAPMLPIACSWLSCSTASWKSLP
jgi:uncharacterized protein